MDGTPLALRVQLEDGTVVKRMSIASNEDYVGNLIAEGEIPEADRFKHLARLYKGQLAAANARHRAVVARMQAAR